MSDQTTTKTADVTRVVSQTPCYALFDPSGKMRKCSLSLSTVTNFFLKDEYKATMWNALFSADDKDRKAIFERFGWSVKTGKFVEA